MGRNFSEWPRDVPNLKLLLCSPAHKFTRSVCRVRLWTLVSRSKQQHVPPQPLAQVRNLTALHLRRDLQVCAELTPTVVFPEICHQLLPLAPLAPDLPAWTSEQSPALLNPLQLPAKMLVIPPRMRFMVIWLRCYREQDGR